MILIKYFQKIKSSITSAEYYLEVLKKPLKTSLLFFASTILILGLVNGANIALKKLPKIKDDVNLALNDLNNHFDKNLEIIWADNQLELNQDYVNIYWPSTIDYKKHHLPKLFGIISNTQEPPYESNLIFQNSSLIYINKNYLYSLQSATQDQTQDNQNSKEDWVEYPLTTIFDGLGSYSLNKQILLKITATISESIDKSFPKIQIIMAIISSILYLLSKSWFLFIESILVYFLFKIYSFSFNFKKVLKLCSNIMIPTAIIETASNILYSDLTLPMATIAFWTILTFISFNLKNVMSKKKTD
ncbi:MAG: hypothetical protein COZ34_02485 [Candidatus Pacebacteria bacterium CG_4_10_14_3_um_filter_34_15]|nr:DUF1189 domain-containing protein [Candidatus Pacearchaeota archaeon]NCQ65615.1 DUF1189 domain-containing protein [Candidatus Paceibacterota bacterium]OIO44910.1 MAG: hypothetical protein AUJ41_01485 [Candidatus Pacebacteria bacterium CG1_02_43_31]PIQ80539.1 MAG: hypothetical protein COV78_05080 [Candidatus Pacebacteria bacterium CG11_big_fil_rev_8_21_14_0_20_34_55]PIX81585.1 MAG: hypothetical protein COZ34_02485 [Candidatus Pacebacteria bacterium CG_4_10_14_3_um_filter_34_15]